MYAVINPTKSVSIPRPWVDVYCKRLNPAISQRTVTARRARFSDENLPEHSCSSPQRLQTCLMLQALVASSIDAVMRDRPNFSSFQRVYGVLQFCIASAAARSTRPHPPSAWRRLAPWSRSARDKTRSEEALIRGRAPPVEVRPSRGHSRRRGLGGRDGLIPKAFSWSRTCKDEAARLCAKLMPQTSNFMNQSGAKALWREAISSKARFEIG
jgi:hypothetical protein